MRDIAIILFFLACVPRMVKHPWVGVNIWIWLSVMNPHRLAYNFAYDLPFAAAAAGLTFIGLVATKDDRRFQFTPPVAALALFTFWMCVTSLFPYHDGAGYNMWSRVMKIMLMTFVAVAVIHDKRQIHWVIWTIVASLGFYGAKGGFFTLATGGGYLVWGPEGSFIEGNNELALALVMTIPLMRYVQIGLKKPWQKWGMSAVMLLSVFSAIGSHSRGALVAIAAMAMFMWWKSRNKFVMGAAFVLVGIVVVSFMPPEWMTRMHTIGTYDEDASAMGRINAWHMAFNLATTRPLGGGFEIYDADVFARFAPNPLDIHAAHSIYFQILGEHGFPGLLLFMSVGALTWISASDAKRKAKGLAGFEWIAPMMDMMKVSMIGYAVGGAFLSLAYFDVPYYVMVVVVATRQLAIEANKRRPVVKRANTFERQDRFGIVPIPLDPLPDAPVEPVGFPRRGDRLRGQGAYAQTIDASGPPPGFAGRRNGFR